MPPPDTWSVVASKGRSRPMQSSSRLSSGEGCSSWGEAPPRKKLAARTTLGEAPRPIFQRGEKEKKSSRGYGYDPSNPGYMSTGAGTNQTTAESSRGSYTPETERVSPPPQQPRRGLDLTEMVQKALEGIVPPGACDEEAEMLYNEAVRTPCAPGTEDDVLMDDAASGPPGDHEQAERYLDEEDAL